MMDEDDFRDAFGTELEKVNQSKTDFIKFEALENFESFKIMEQFVAELTDKNFQLELENVLVNKKPFQNFKQNELEKRVETQLEHKRPAHNKEV